MDTSSNLSPLALAAARQETASIAVIIDYQNVHLTAHEAFATKGDLRKYQTAINPILYAEEVVRQRNRLIGQRTLAGATNLPEQGHLDYIKVFRGEANAEQSPFFHKCNEEQKRRWETDPRVDVEYRDLYYRWNNETGDYVSREKGIDVLIALEAYRLTISGAYDIIIIASHDSDLIPVFEVAERDAHAGSGRLELACWDINQRHRMEPAGAWTTILRKQSFVDVRDEPRPY